MSNKSEISYAGSPLQNTMANMVMPPLEKAFGGAMQGNQNQNLWNIPQYNVPNAPQTTPYSVGQYQVQGYSPTGYNVPGISGLMPNTGWYESLDPNIQQSMMEPTNVAAREMLNVMGGQGQMSARGGYSGEAQTALADLYSKGAQQAGMNAWNMISPIQQGQWGAQLGANQYGAQAQNQAMQDLTSTQNQMFRDVWGGQTGATQASWGQNNIADMSQWQAQLGQNQWGAQNQVNQNSYPYTMAPSLWGGSVPNPVVSPTAAGNLGSSILPMLMYAGSQLFGGS